MFDIEALFVAITPATLLLIKEQLVAYEAKLDVNGVEHTRVENTVVALDTIWREKVGLD
jgi:hypothetical protein